jgi:SAM-dependent methyltransferase
MLTDRELLASSVVANSTMNRGRGLEGVNSYERELRFDILNFLEERVKLRGRAVWYDACCGEGRALNSAAERLIDGGWGSKVRLLGLDLIGSSVDVPGVEIAQGDVVTHRWDEPIDLVTCVHGLHYLGDKLGFIENAYSMLADGGLLMGHLDASNIRCEAGTGMTWLGLLRQARRAGVEIKVEQHRLSVRKSAVALRYNVEFRGGVVSERPNYTGITVIDSWYR